MKLGDGQDQGSDDDGGNDHDQLPAPGRVPQLLQEHHLQPGGPGARRRLHARNPRQARQRPLS